MSLLHLEKKYCEYLNKQYIEMVNHYDDIRLNYTIPLNGKDVTKAILLRLKAYYDTQNRIKEFLNKRYSPAGSDFFVETIIFYLKLILDKKKIGLEVHSEKQIIRQRGAIRPDISIWRNNQIVASVECKTQLGWNRNKWEQDFLKRELRLKKDFPNAKPFLLVMTSENWSGFQPNNKKVGKQYFTLSSVWPTKISGDNIDKIIINPIESLFNAIVQRS